MPGQLPVCAVLRGCEGCRGRRGSVRTGGGAQTDAGPGRIARWRRWRHSHDSCRTGIYFGGVIGGADRLPGDGIREVCRRWGWGIESCS